ncbi:plasmid SOS inhibition protein PsiA [Escherichia coli]|nr:plasmid SOS inhibition protein PsiA [Escherichia coli]
MPSLTAEELRGNRSQWLYAVDVLIETQGEVCLLPFPAMQQSGCSRRCGSCQGAQSPQIRTGHAKVQPPAGEGGRAESPCVPGAGRSG